MDKYLAAYNDDDDDLEEGEELTGSDEDRKSEGNIVENQNTENGKIQIEEISLRKNENENNSIKSDTEDGEEKDSNEEQINDQDFVISDDDQDFFRLKKRSREESNFI